MHSCLLLPRVLQAAGDELDDLQQWWYLDDSTLLGSSQHTIQRAYQLLQKAFDTQALRISIPKTGVLRPPAWHLLGPRIVTLISRHQPAGNSWR